MRPETARTIHIAAAMIDDAEGRLLLVRKSGTKWFTQAGGKIEPGENPLAALRRELQEEIGLSLGCVDARYLGLFEATAANEAGCIVQAEIFHIRCDHEPETNAEIAEAIWISHEEALGMPLAPLTREHLLPLSADL